MRNQINAFDVLQLEIFMLPKPTTEQFTFMRKI